MKKGQIRRVGTLFAMSVLLALGFAGHAQLFADVEIDLDEASSMPTATPVPAKAAPAPAAKALPTQAPAVKPTAAPQNTPVPETEESGKNGVESSAPEASSGDMDNEKTAAEESEVKEGQEVESEEAASAPEIIHGQLKMKDIYEAGKRAYQEKEYDQALKYWKKAVAKKDRYTPSFYYAEAYAMMGVIYQFHIIHYRDAYNCYKNALKYERKNETARKHIKEVKRKLNK
ncbi:MAG TPA: hypothetical protein VMV05_05310 [bacterium]|nr:hypothetical protein [bacterium]